MCTTAIYKLYHCIIFFSLSKHKANTAELHPKVRQTCSQLTNWFVSFAASGSGLMGSVTISTSLTLVTMSGGGGAEGTEMMILGIWSW